VNKANAVKVASMFAAFLKSKAPAVPTITPNGSGANPGGEPPAQPTVADSTPPSPAEIRAYYTRSSLGKVKEAERAQFEARLKLRAPR
jgi:hypothetical protein